MCSTGSLVLAFNMTTAQFFLGASLFVLLIVDICCFPSKKASNPSASYGSSTNVGFRSNQGAPSSQNSPGVMANGASSGVYAPSSPPVPQPEPSFYQPAVQRGPAASGSSSATGPVQSGFRSSAATGNPAFQPSPPQDINWVVAPPIFGAEEMAAVGYSGAGLVRPPFPPPEYQAGELSHYENSQENGDYQMETEDQGFLPPPPFMLMPAGPSFPSPPRPQPDFGRSWIVYPYYDYMFMTGQYPPGTVSHSSSSFEQGTDYWQDAHYVRDYPPYNPGPLQQAPPEVPQSFKDPQPPVKGGHGGAAVNQPSSHGTAMQPTRRWS